MLDVYRLLRQRRRHPAVASFLSRVQQQLAAARPNHLLLRLLLLGLPASECGQLLDAWPGRLLLATDSAGTAADAATGPGGSGSGSSSRKQRGGAVGVLYLTRSWLAFTTVFDSGASSSPDVTRILPLRRITHARLVTAAAPPAPAAGGDGSSSGDGSTLALQLVAECQPGSAPELLQLSAAAASAAELGDVVHQLAAAAAGTGWPLEASLAADGLPLMLPARAAAAAARRQAGQPAQAPVSAEAAGAGAVVSGSAAVAPAASLPAASSAAAATARGMRVLAVDLQPSRPADADADTAAAPQAAVGAAQLPLKVLPCCCYSAMENVRGLLVLTAEQLLFLPDTAPADGAGSGEQAAMLLRDVRHVRQQPGWFCSWVCCAGDRAELLLGGISADVAAALVADIERLAAAAAAAQVQAVRMEEAAAEVAAAQPMCEE